MPVLCRRGMDSPSTAFKTRVAVSRRPQASAGAVTQAIARNERRRVSSRRPAKGRLNHRQESALPRRKMSGTVGSRSEARAKGTDGGAVDLKEGRSPRDSECGLHLQDSAPRLRPPPIGSIDARPRMQGTRQAEPFPVARNERRGAAQRRRMRWVAEAPTGIRLAPSLNGSAVANSGSEARAPRYGDGAVNRTWLVHNAPAITVSPSKTQTSPKSGRYRPAPPRSLPSAPGCPK